MKTPSRRPLLASILAAVLVGSPVTTAFAQEPAAPPAPHNVAQGAVPISLGVTKHDYTHAPKPFPKLLAPYTSRYVDPGVLTNSPRLEQLIHDGKLNLSLQDAISLALENSMDIVVQRYNPWLADTDLLKTKAGSFGRGIPGADFGSSSANVPTLSYDPVLTHNSSITYLVSTANNPFTSGTGINTLVGLSEHSSVFNTQYQQSFHTGTTLTAFWDNTRSSSGSSFNFLNPSVEPSIGISVAQQLLQGRGSFINRRNMLIAQNNRKIADLAFAQQAIT